MTYIAVRLASRAAHQEARQASSLPVRAIGPPQSAQKRGQQQQEATASGCKEPAPIRPPCVLSRNPGAPKLKNAGGLVVRRAIEKPGGSYMHPARHGLAHATINPAHCPTPQRAIASAAHYQQESALRC